MSIIANYKQFVNPVRKLRAQTGFLRNTKMSYKKAQKKRVTLVLPSIARQFSNGVKHFPKYIQKRLPKEVAVINISAKESRRLNLLYRKKDKPTNVLSFRYDSEYGEILLCPDIIKKEARAQGNSYKYQMTWMAVHGMMHLGGLHHEGGGAAIKKFERLEEQVLGKIEGRMKNAK